MFKKVRNFVVGGALAFMLLSGFGVAATNYQASDISAFQASRIQIVADVTTDPSTDDLTCRKAGGTQQEY